MGVAAAAERPGAIASRGGPNGTPIAWNPNHELDIREWAAAGRRIGAVGRSIQWLLGDWIAYGTSKFGERYVRASQITGYDTQSLMNMVYVASRFPISRRRENLSWSHHEAVAALDDADQSQWLDQALAHRWSVADLRMMLRSARRERDAERESASNGGNVALDEGPADADAARQLGSGQAHENHSDAAPAEIVKCPRCGEKVVVAP